MNQSSLKGDKRRKAGRDSKGSYWYEQTRVTWFVSQVYILASFFSLPV